jgi:acetyl esterase/lipase
MPSPQLEALVSAIRAQPRNPNITIAELRAGYEQTSSLMPLAPDVQCEPLTVAGRPAEWLAVDGQSPAATVLYLHGGGYCIGSLSTHRRVIGDFVRAGNARALALDYRLAPEHPYPAALEDATAAYRWLLAEGIDPQRLVIAGDSAGGGLTAATLLALRDAGDPLPAGAVLMSAWLDLANSGDSIQTKASVDPIIQIESLDEWAGYYLNGVDPKTPHASPFYAELHGLPPLLVQCGTAETLLDDSVRFAERAQAAGVDVTLELWDDMIHIWHAFAFMLPEAQEAIDRVGAFIRERTAGV